MGRFSRIAALFALALTAFAATNARAEQFYYLVGLAPDGDNFLALRSEPSAQTGARLAQLDPRTLLRTSGRTSGNWREVEVVTTEHAGRTGWVNGRFLGCCLDLPPDASIVYVKPGQPLSLRENPSIDAPIQRTMNAGTLVVLLGDGVPDGVRNWMPVEVLTTDARGSRGYASDRFLECCVTIGGAAVAPPSPPQVPTAPAEPAPVVPTPAAPAIAGTGTGFVVGAGGEILTNEHVTRGCTALEVADRGPARLVREDPQNDLAVIRLADASGLTPLYLRDRGVRLGDDVIALGYPFGQILGNALNVTTGNIASLSGLGGDTRHFQMTAPIQPGNSGGPLFDRAGDVIGVVNAKMNDIAMLEAAGTVPQNVNFAIKVAVAASFLDALGIDFSRAPESVTETRSIADVVDDVRRSTVQVICIK